jgi:glycosyltransferase involved in cell wall biosynthesis
MSLPSVSAVIATYRRRDLVAHAVRAVAADPYVDEIVVVVDGSPDGSYELLTGMAVDDPRIRPVWRENGGEAAARQSGVENATGDIVLLLDDDVIAGPGLARGHAGAHARTGAGGAGVAAGPSAAGVVVLGYMPARRPAVRGPGGFATDLYADEYEAQCRRYESDPSTILRNYWAGNVSMRRVDALRVGLLSGAPRLGYHSDQEFGLRCVRAGLTGVFDRELVAEHRHERDVDTFLRQARSAGAARYALERLFPDLIRPGGLRDILPPPVRAAVAAAAAPGLCRVAAPVLRWNLRRAGQLRLWRVESMLARYLRQVELRRGYRQRPALAG